MPVTFQPECGPKCRSKLHNLEVNSVVTKGSLLDLQAYSRLCHTWAQHNDTAGRSALHVAASCGKLDMVEWLVTERHQDPSQKDKESGWTALHRALFYGQLATARLLVQVCCWNISFMEWNCSECMVQGTSKSQKKVFVLVELEWKAFDCLTVVGNPWMELHLQYMFFIQY